MSGLVSTPLRAPAAWDAAPARRVAREPLRTHSIKAPSSFLRRACPDGRLPAQAQHPDPGTGSGTPMVTGQPPAHHSRRKRAPGRPPGPPARRRKPLLPRSPPPSSRPPAARRAASCSPPTAPHRPRSPRTPGGPFHHLLTQPPTAPRNQPTGPRHPHDSPAPSPTTSRTTCSPSPLPSPCADTTRSHPHLSKQYSFHHCPRNTRHLTPDPDGGVFVFRCC